MSSDDVWRTFDQYKRARLRFLRKVEIVGDCWVWRGATRGHYGIMRIDGKIRNAHRAAYALFVAPVSDGISVLHRQECKNKLCCNPDHLYLDVQERHLTPGLVSSGAGP